MRILKEGDNKTEYIFDCGVCGCMFSLSVSEYATENWASKCPCCGNLISKHTAYRDTKGIYHAENEGDKNNEKS